MVWAVQTLAASTAAMLVVAMARTWLRTRCSPGLIYALWALPALRMMVPPLPMLEARAVLVPAGAFAGPVISGASHKAMAVTALWLAGAALCLAWQIARSWQFIRVARAEVVGTGARVGRVHILHSGGVDGPVAIGLWRRRVVLPLDFRSRFDGPERHLALIHELMHHRRGDLLANLVAMLVLSLHWFNPVAHWAYRMFRADQELACDADVLGHAGAGCRAAYGRVLLKASVSMPAALCGLSDKALLKQRLRGLAIDVPARRPVVLMLTLLLGCVGLLLSAATRKAPEWLPSPRLLPVKAPATVVVRFRPATVATHIPPHPTMVPRPVPDPEPSSADPASPSDLAAMRGHLVDDPAYLGWRRALGQARVRERGMSASELAADRGRPLIEAPSTG